MKPIHHQVQVHHVMYMSIVRVKRLLARYVTFFLFFLFFATIHVHLALLGSTWLYISSTTRQYDTTLPHTHNTTTTLRYSTLHNTLRYSIGMFGISRMARSKYVINSGDPLIKAYKRKDKKPIIQSCSQLQTYLYLHKSYKQKNKQRVFVIDKKNKKN
jgi:hypothetical protein